MREWLADEAGRAEPVPGSRRSPPAEMSRTDPAAAWAARPRGRFGYALNLLMDAPGGVVLEVEASPARFAAEVDAGRAMLVRAAERFEYRPKRVVADTAYGSATFLAFVRDQGARAHIPVLERSEQTSGLFPRYVFAFDRERDRYTCPDGKVLAHRGLIPGSGRTAILRGLPTARPARCAPGAPMGGIDV